MKRHRDICFRLSSQLQFGSVSAESQFLNIKMLAQLLNNPQDKVPTVHIAGTNGKGSTAAYIASVCRAAGLKTGLFTSPHLRYFNERIKINGKAISNADFDRLASRVFELSENNGWEFSGFAVLTIMAFLYFDENDCDIVIVETGLGGRLDATNIISRPFCCVLTTMGLDHTKILGNTLEKITAEKCGIIKAGAGVVAMSQTGSIDAIVRRSALKNNAQLRMIAKNAVSFRRAETKSQTFNYGPVDNWRIMLQGRHQLKNAALAIEACRFLSQKFPGINDKMIKKGLAVAKWPGRMEIFHSEGKTVVVDGAHNPQGAEVLAQFIAERFGNKITLVFSGLRTKDTEGIIKKLAPVADKVYIVPVISALANSTDVMAGIFTASGVPAECCATVKQALQQAVRLSETVVVCGTLHIVSQARACMRRL